MPYPTHLTLTEEERAKLGIGPATDSLPTSPTVPGKRSRLLKHHSGNVTFPDTTEGTFSYERLAPDWHRFYFRYSDGTKMPRQYLTEPLTNDPRSIERKAQELAEKAYRDAIEQERREYFCRASESAGRKRKRIGFQFRADRAKEIAGKYALCVRVGPRLIPISSVLFQDIFAAHEAWKEQKHLVIGCANRLDRRWEEPRYNPAHADGHPRKEVSTTATLTPEKEAVHDAG
jgi:hypothetical protein